MGDNTLLIIWIASIIFFGVLEAMTAQLVSIWFVIGSVAGLITNLLGAPVGVQIAVFVIVSIIALIITRPLVKKYIQPKIQRTNADKVLDEQGIVIEEIDNINAKGLVKINGQVWTARSADNSTIPEDAKVQVERIEGVKLIVKNI